MEVAPPRDIDPCALVTAQEASAAVAKATQAACALAEKALSRVN